MDEETYQWVQAVVTDRLADPKRSEWAQNFYSDQAERLEKYGRDTRFSPKQLQILDRDAEKMGHPPRPGTQSEDDMEY